VVSQSTTQGSRERRSLAGVDDRAEAGVRNPKLEVGCLKEWNYPWPCLSLAAHMITKSEIELTARELDVHLSNVQRDYVLGWLLAGIYTVSELRHVLILKGGNCLRKAYFEH
jgi:hypothetical protein